MLVAIQKNVAAQIEAGKTEDEVAAMESLTVEWYSDAETEGQFIDGEKIRRTAYKSILSSIKIDRKSKQ